MKKIIVFVAMLAVGLLYAVDPFGVAVSPKSSVIERRSADELQKYLTLMTGRKFKRVPVKDARFLIGHDFVKDPSLGNEGFIIKSENGIVRIGGGTSEGRGTFYGVYEYLEQCGVRFWTPSEEYIPKVAHEKLPAVNTRQESRVKLKDTPNGKYVYVKLASNFPATLSGSVWMAPLNNPKVVKNFYVDHLIFVRKD